MHERKREREIVSPVREKGRGRTSERKGERVDGGTRNKVKGLIEELKVNKRLIHREEERKGDRDTGGERDRERERQRERERKDR